ncbi:hypothetical protein ARMSODRAFT_413921 [Armillaria solidipes]|uniref:Uncharacterized protein n=1 Tax=Armillaria solidipes TaxID=1076256 RepID=A0A2H3CID3_9AGAR|nr:hypothetical protein ARMSODRAFT_413921 [Armillaria solidipes]
MHQELGPMVRVWNTCWETHDIWHQSLLHFPRSPIQIWPARKLIVWTNLPEYLRGSERGMRPSDVVQSLGVLSSLYRASDIQSQANMCCDSHRTHCHVPSLQLKSGSLEDCHLPRFSQSQIGLYCLPFCPRRRHLYFCEAALHLHTFRSVCSHAHPSSALL